MYDGGDYMQKLRNLLIITLVFAIFLSFAGCNRQKEEDNTTTSQTQSNSNIDTTKENTTENITLKPKDQLTTGDIISYAIESAANIENCDLILDINSNMTFFGFPITYTSTTTGTAFAEPMKMMTKTTAVVKNVSTTNSESYIETVGDKVYVYSRTDNGEWKNQEYSVVNNSGQFNVLQMISLCLSSIENMSKSDDQVNGIKAYKIQGTVSGQSVENIVNQSGLMTNLSGLGGDADIDMSGVYQGLQEMSITLWIDEDNYNTLQYAMDVTEISSRVLERMKESGTAQNGAILNSLRIKTFDILTTLKSFNNANDFQVPSEAKQ